MNISRLTSRFLFTGCLCGALLCAPAAFAQSRQSLRVVMEKALEKSTVQQAVNQPTKVTVNSLQQSVVQKTTRLALDHALKRAVSGPAPLTRAQQKIYSSLDEAAKMARLSAFGLSNEGPLDYTLAKSVSRAYSFNAANPATLGMLSKLSRYKLGKSVELAALDGRLAQLRAQLPAVFEEYKKSLGPEQLFSNISIKQLVYVGKPSATVKELRMQDWILGTELFLRAESRDLTDGVLKHLAGWKNEGGLALERNPSLSLRLTSPDAYKELAGFYTRFLGCTPQNPCRIEVVGDSVRLYAPDNSFWVRLGAHEAQKMEDMHFHVHYVFDPKLPAAPDIKLFVNYVVPVWLGPAENRLAAKPVKWQGFGSRMEEFISNPLKEMAARGLLVQ